MKEFNLMQHSGDQWHFLYAYDCKVGENIIATIKMREKKIGTL